MSIDEAQQLLRKGLSVEKITPIDELALHTLAKRLGEWPLLLGLANAFIYVHMRCYKQSLSEALLEINEALDEEGLTTFDADDQDDRNLAVKKTLGVSLRLLNADELAHFGRHLCFLVYMSIGYTLKGGSAAL
jgi:hypothetical protein